MKPKNRTAKLKEVRNDAQRQHILDEASLLFIEKGFGGTNINDIADAIGVSRTALYYYFPSKKAILQALTEEVTEKASELSRSVSDRASLPAPEALRELVTKHAELILTHPLQFRVAERSEDSLPEAQRQVVETGRRAVFGHFVRVIQRGVGAKQFRDVDPRITALSIIGMCNWCAWWFDPHGEIPAEKIAQSIAEFSCRALAPDDVSAWDESVQSAVDQIRQGLSVIDAHLRKPTKNNKL